MHLSIVIPTFNEADNIGKLVAYLVAHTKAECTEVIVVNACKTTDRSAQIAEQAGATVYECTDCSRAAQLNMGARKATYNTLYFVHADVLPPENFAENIEQALQEGHDFGWFSYRFNSSSPWLKINARYTKQDGLFAGGGDQTLFITKANFEALGGFREAYRIMEDFEFMKRAKRTDLSYTIIPNDVLVSARKYTNNSYLKVNIANLIMYILFSVNCPQQWMLRFYRSILN